MAESDHELMRRSGAGDAAAFETLVRRWEPWIVRLLGRLCTDSTSTAPERVDGVNPHSDIDDLAQEVFIRVLTSSARYRSDYEFSTWLSRIVLNVARDAVRRRNRRWKLLSNHKPSHHKESPAETAGRKETEHHVTEALLSLSPKYREPLVLRHYGDLTFAEVAEALNLPTSTVKSRVHRALEELRTELKRRGIDERESES